MLSYMIRKMKFTRLCLAVLIASLVCHVSCYGQVAMHDMKAAMVFKLSSHIIWPNENELINLKIGFYGSDEDVYNALMKSKDAKIRGKKIVPVLITSPDEFNTVHVLYVDPIKSKGLSQIGQKLGNHPVLIISDDSEDSKNVMLNLIYDNENESISYEINRANILISGMNIESELLLLRGTEIDVRQIYRDMKKELEKEKIAVAKQQKLLEEQEIQVRNYKSQISLLSKNASELNFDIGEKTKALDKVSEQVKDKETLLKTQQATLSKQKIQVSKLQEDLDKQKLLISSRSQTLDSLQEERNKNQALILEQSKILSTKEVQISNQKSIIYLSGIFILIFIVLAIITYRAYMSKKRTAEKLSSSNKKLRDQHRHIINLNKELSLLNDVLEVKVEERTKGLQQTNEQLTEYAFVNSHLLRAPLSRILGLSNIMALNSSEKDKEMVVAMQKSAKELDAIVRRINQLLDSDGSFNREKIESLIKMRIKETETDSSNH